MEAAEEMEVEHEDDEPVVHNPAAQVFAIPGLMSQIISHCHFLSSTDDLLQLRLVSRDFHEAVLDLKVTPGDLPTPRLSISKMTTSESDDSSIRTLDEMGISKVDSRMCRILVAKFTTDYSVYDYSIRENLLGVIRVHGTRIQKLKLSRVPERSLVPVMRAVDIHCPNVQNLELTTVLECPRHGPMHEGVVAIADRFGPFTPHFGLTKMSFERIEEGHYDAGESQVCNLTTDVLAAVVAGAPNLETLHVGGDAFLRLDLARNPRLKTFSIMLHDVQDRHQMQEIWDMIASRSDTLEYLKFNFDLGSFPEGADPRRYDEVPALGPNPPTFSKLKKLKFESDFGCTDGLSSAFVRTILGGRAPLLEDLRMQVGEVVDNWHNALEELDRHPLPPQPCMVLKLSSFYCLGDVGPLLGYLPDLFPNLTRLSLMVGRDKHWGLQHNLKHELKVAFLRLMRCSQLKELKWSMEGTVSIQQLTQLLSVLGQGFFMTRGLRIFEFTASRFIESFCRTEMRELVRIFGLDELEEFLPSLLWMRAMESVKFDKIVLPRVEGIRERLLEFVQENQLPITFNPIY